jgi:hypothetical protein
MPKYSWRENSPVPSVDADTFGTVIEQIAHGAPFNLVKAAMIVDAARSRSSPIHKIFPWNDQLAAEAHRRFLARQYLGALQIVRVQITGSQQISSRGFYSVRSGGQRGYLDRGKILSSDDFKRQVITAAKEELERFVAKFSGVLALGTFIPTLNEVIEDMHREIDALAAAATAPPQRKAKRKQAASGRRATAAHV